MNNIIRTYTRARNRRAFTVVEVTVGMTVFSLVIASIFQALSFSIRAHEASQDMNRISQTVQYQMETLRGTKWIDLLDMEGTTTINVDSSGIPTLGDAEVPHGWQAFSLDQEITLESLDHYRVTLEATWVDRNGRSRSYTIQTWISNNGLNEYYTMSTN